MKSISKEASFLTFGIQSIISHIPRTYFPAFLISSEILPFRLLARRVIYLPNEKNQASGCFPNEV